MQRFFMCRPRPAHIARPPSLGELLCIAAKRVRAVQAMLEELPLVRLEPAESARLPRGGTLRTPVYVTQARRQGARNSSPSSPAINGASTGRRGSLLCACTEVARPARGNALHRRPAPPKHVCCFTQPGTPPLARDVRCHGKRSACCGGAGKGVRQHATRRHRPPTHAGHAGTARRAEPLRWLLSMPVWPAATKLFFTRL